MANINQIKYTGTTSEEALCEFMRKISAGGYAFYSSVFNEILVYTSDKLPTGAHAPSDYPIGYWKNGKHFEWSKARIIRDQNTGIIGD